MEDKKKRKRNNHGKGPKLTPDEVELRNECIMKMRQSGEFDRYVICIRRFELNN